MAVMFRLIAWIAKTVRQLELDLGVREWDSEDDRAFVARFKSNLLSQVRYIDGDLNERAAEALAAERAKYSKAALHV